MAVGYRVHDISLVPTAEEATLVGHLGPDLLGPDWDAAEAARRLRRPGRDPSAKRSSTSATWPAPATSTRPKSVSCVGFHPGRRSATSVISTRLVKLAHRLLVANRERYDQVTTGDTSAGQADVGLRPRRPAVPAVRQHHSGRVAGRPAPAQLLVSALPTRAGAGNGSGRAGNRRTNELGGGGRARPRRTATTTVSRGNAIRGRPRRASTDSRPRPTPARCACGQHSTPARGQALRARPALPVRHAQRGGLRHCHRWLSRPPRQ